MNYLHIFGIVLKNLYLLRKSPHRIFHLFYFITMELLLWGFIAIWLRGFSGINQNIDFVLFLLTALIFWEMFVRAGQGISVSFLEDVWARQMMNLFGSPLRPIELISGFILVSVIYVTIAFFYISALALLLYALNIWHMGFYIIPFFLNIFIFGWTLGLFTVSIVMRLGPSAEIIAWSIPMVFMPFSAIYYPLSVLPLLAQKIAFFLPTTHIFEGIREVLLKGVFPLQNIVLATGLNLVYLGIAILFLYLTIRTARKKGLIARLVTD